MTGSCRAIAPTPAIRGSASARRPVSFAGFGPAMVSMHGRVGALRRAQVRRGEEHVMRDQLKMRRCRRAGLAAALVAAASLAAVASPGPASAAPLVLTTPGVTTVE